MHEILSSEAWRSVGEALARTMPRAVITSVEQLPGQASARKYFRLFLEGCGEQSVVLVLLGASPLKSEEGGGSRGSGPQVPDFTDMQRFLSARGVPVPQLIADRWDLGFMIQTDLGDETLFRRVQGLSSAELAAALAPGVDFLLDFQAKVWSCEPHTCVGFSRSFTRELLLWELEHFQEWYLEAFLGLELSPAVREALAEEFGRLAGFMAGQSPRLVHRDFQSTNLMMRQDGFHLIDFQDALLGPEPYDLVAYLRDSYLPLEPEGVDALVQRYMNGREPAGLPRVSPDFQEVFHLQTIQRKLKDAGRFVFIDRVKGNPSYLRFIPDTLGYVGNALSRVRGWDRLATLLGEMVPEVRSA